MRTMTMKRRLLVYGLFSILFLSLLIACGDAVQAQSTRATKIVAPGTVLVKYEGHTSEFISSTWSPDGASIASAGRSDATVQVWNARTGKLRWKHNLSGASEVSWSPNGKYLAVGILIEGGDGGKGLVAIYTAATGALHFTSQTYQYGVGAVVWSPDSTSIAYTVTNGVIRILDLKNHGKYNKIYHSAVSTTGGVSTVGSVAWSPNGKLLAWAVTTPGDAQVQVINIATGKIIRTYKGHNDLINTIVWSPDSQKIASASNDTTVRIWNIAHGTTLLIYKGHTQAVVGLSWSSDGKFLASGSSDATVRLFNATTGSTIFIFKKHSAGVFSVTWSPDSTRIVSAGADRFVLVWQAVGAKY